MPHHPSPIGTRYRLDDVLGGTASRVHQAHDLLLQRDVAIKSFPGDDGPQRWRRDGRLRQRLGTGQAIEVLDGAPDGDDGPFVVMPLARGGSLDLATTAWEPWPAAVLVARLAVGLRRLHGLGAVHGGVAADAILLDPQHGPRWAGHGGAPADGATAEDDVLAFARVAAAVVAATSGGDGQVGEAADEVVDAVRALVRGPGDIAGLERLRAALAAEVARHGPRHPAGEVLVPALPAVRPDRRRSAVLAACAAAAVMGSVLGIGAGVVGGEAPVAAASDVAGGADLVPPAAPALAPAVGAPSIAVARPAAPVTTVPREPAAGRAEQRNTSRPSDDVDVAPVTASGERPRDARRADGDERSGRDAPPPVAETVEAGEGGDADAVEAGEVEDTRGTDDADQAGATDDRREGDDGGDRRSEDDRGDGRDTSADEDGDESADDGRSGASA